MAICRVQRRFGKTRTKSFFSAFFRGGIFFNWIAAYLLGINLIFGDLDHQFPTFARSAEPFDSHSINGGIGLTKSSGVSGCIFIVKSYWRNSANPWL